MDVAELESKASTLRIFEMSVVPGLLQVPGYIRCLMTFSGIATQEIETVVAGRLARQGILYDPSRRLEFLITEQAVLSRFCSGNISLLQVDRLRALLDLPNIRIGFLTSRSTLRAIPLNSFSLFDRRIVTIETFTGEISLFGEHDVAAYGDVFDMLAATALWGSAGLEFIEYLRDMLRKDVGRCASESGRFIAEGKQ